MIIKLLVILFLNGLVCFYCQAQGSDEVTGSVRPGNKTATNPVKGVIKGKRVTPQVKKRDTSMVALNLVTNDTSWIKIDGKDSGIIIKDTPKTVKLPARSYKL